MRSLQQFIQSNIEISSHSAAKEIILFAYELQAMAKQAVREATQSDAAWEVYQQALKRSDSPLLLIEYLAFGYDWKDYPRRPKDWLNNINLQGDLAADPILKAIIQADDIEITVKFLHEFISRYSEIIEAGQGVLVFGNYFSDLSRILPISMFYADFIRMVESHLTGEGAPLHPGNTGNANEGTFSKENFYLLEQLVFFLLKGIESVDILPSEVDFYMQNLEKMRPLVERMKKFGLAKEDAAALILPICRLGYLVKDDWAKDSSRTSRRSTLLIEILEKNPILWFVHLIASLYQTFVDFNHVSSLSLDSGSFIAESEFIKAVQELRNTLQNEGLYQANARGIFERIEAMHAVRMALMKDTTREQSIALLGQAGAMLDQAKELINSTIEEDYDATRALEVLEKLQERIEFMQKQF